MSLYSFVVLAFLALACGVVRFSDEGQRGGACFIAASMLFFWAIEESAFSFPEANPIRLLWAAGVKVPSEDFWPLYDGVLGALAMTVTVSFWAGDKKSWWGPAIWLLCLWSVCIHAGYIGGLWDAKGYTDKLEAPLWGRLLVLYAIGIRGVAEHVGILGAISTLGSRIRSWSPGASYAVARRNRGAR